MKVKLQNVRGSFIAAFTPTAGGEKDPSKAVLKYRFTSILDKKANAADIKLVEETIKKALAETYTAKGKAIPKDFKACLRDGSEYEKDDGTPMDGYGPEVMFVPSTNKTAPTVFDQSKTQLTVEDQDRIQSGYYFNVLLDIWVQDPKLNPKFDASWGRRINATFLGCQLVKVGATFSKAAKASADDFSEVAVDTSVLD
jgi:hypothetical protein